MWLATKVRPALQNIIFRQLYVDAFSFLPAPLRLRLLFEREMAKYVVFARDVAGAGPVPPAIHAIWFGGDLPPIHRKCIDSWRRKMPHLDLKIWNEKSLPVESVPFSMAALRKKDYRKLSDYWRLRVLRDHGGIYADCDVFFQQAIPDTWLTNSLTLFPQSKSESTSFVTNSMVTATKGYPLVSGMVEFIERHMPHDRDAVWTGPNLFTVLYCALRAQGLLDVLNVALVDCNSVTANKRKINRPFSEISELVALTQNVVCCPSHPTIDELKLYFDCE
jgi:mannosyltransferase OCH1-like enzyme